MLCVDVGSLAVLLLLLLLLLPPVADARAHPPMDGDKGGRLHHREPCHLLDLRFDSGVFLGGGRQCKLSNVRLDVADHARHGSNWLTFNGSITLPTLADCPALPSDRARDRAREREREHADTGVLQSQQLSAALVQRFGGVCVPAGVDPDSPNGFLTLPIAPNVALCASTAGAVSKSSGKTRTGMMDSNKAGPINTTTTTDVDGEERNKDTAGGVPYISAQHCLCPPRAPFMLLDSARCVAQPSAGAEVAAVDCRMVAGMLRFGCAAAAGRGTSGGKTWREVMLLGTRVAWP